MPSTKFDELEGNFLAAMTKKMPKVPEQKMKKFVENPEELQKALSRALIVPHGFEIWKTIKTDACVGFDGIQKTVAAKTMLENFSFFKKEETILNLVLATKKDLGLDCQLDIIKGVEYDDFCVRAVESGLNLCPLEIIFQLEKCCADLPKDKLLIIATKPIIGPNGKLNLFTIGSNKYGLWLDCCNYGKVCDSWSGKCQYILVG